MEKTTSFRDHAEFTYCRYTGPLDVEPLINLAEEVNEYLHSNNYQAVLVDITESRGLMSTYQRFRHGSDISNFVSPDFKIALFARLDQTYGRFWETVTRNRNLKTKVFTEKFKAEEWLMSGSDT